MPGSPGIDPPPPPCQIIPCRDIFYIKTANVNNPLQKTPQSHHARSAARACRNLYKTISFVRISRSLVTKTYKNLRFPHPNFSNKTCACSLAEIIRKPYEFNDFVQIQRFHFTARCTRDTLVMRPRHESLAKSITKSSRALRRARMSKSLQNHQFRNDFNQSARAHVFLKNGVRKP